MLGGGSTSRRYPFLVEAKKWEVCSDGGGDASPHRAVFRVGVGGKLHLKISALLRKLPSLNPSPHSLLSKIGTL